MSNLLEFTQVCKSFGERPVLSNVSLTVARGEAVGLVGVNGAGKTTLIRGLLDLNRIDDGTILINGLPQTHTAARQALTYLAERFSAPTFATGYELIRHLLALHGTAATVGRVEEEARALGLDPAMLARPTREYSKGMMQKLGLIACILPDCPLLILDEPMSGLDPLARALFKRRLSGLKDAGVTLFFSTHLLIDVDSLCDRIVVLNGGQVVWDGAPQQLIAERAATSLEQAFLNLVDPAHA
jgi:ABC-2 type transport system ATP-binding protein